MQVDNNKAQSFGVQTCDLNGCYADTQMSKELINELMGGKQLTITFENTSREKITVPLALSNFSEAYNRIK